MEDLYTPQQLADWLGVPVATVYKWNSEGKGPKRLSIGKHTRYRLKDIDAWLESQMVLDATGLDAGHQ